MNKALQTGLSTLFAVLTLLGAGCSVTPPSPAGDKVAPAEPVAEPVQPLVAPPAAVAPVPQVTATAVKSEAQKAEKTAAKPPAKPAAAPAQKPQAAAPVPAPLALDTLEQRLKDTPAIGTFTKLTLKNQVDDLLDRFRAYYDGRGSVTIAQLRQHYEQLLAKVHGLLKDGDPALASAVVNSREAIWGVLTDPAKFAKL